MGPNKVKFISSLSTTSIMDRQLLREKFIRNLSNENIKTRVSREMVVIARIVDFVILILNFVLRTTEAPVCMFSLMRLFD